MHIHFYLFTYIICILGKIYCTQDEIVTPETHADDVILQYKSQSSLEDKDVSLVASKNHNTTIDDSRIFKLNEIENTEIAKNILEEDSISIIDGDNDELVTATDSEPSGENEQVHTDESENECSFVYRITDKSIGNNVINTTFEIEVSEIASSNEIELPNKIEEINSKPLRNKMQNLLTCYICNTTRMNRKDLEMHIIKFHKSIIKFKCKFCSQLYERYRSFTRHVQTHTIPPQFKCDECGKNFTQKIGLQNHKFKHKNERSFQCDICDKTFRQLSSLYNHKKVHSGVTYTCEYCSEIFSSDSNLNQHKKAKHLNVRDKICKICEKGYASTSALYYHTLTHSKECRYQCVECGKNFRTSGILKKHMETHSNERTSYVCNYCSKDFFAKQSLLTHVKNCKSRTDIDKRDTDVFKID